MVVHGGLLTEEQPAVDLEHLAGHPAAVGRGEERDRVGDVVRPPTRPSATIDATPSAAPGTSSSQEFMSVLVMPGETVFTVIPLPPNRFARLRPRTFSAPFVIA